MRTKLPREIKSEETKQKILSTTERILSSYDFKYLTIRNICEEAGVAYGSFYHHFSSKENLLYTYMNQLYQTNLQAHPIPEWIHADDYIKRILWYVELLGYFCEAAGRDMISYIYMNCSLGMVEDTVKDYVQPILRDADAMGNIDDKRNKDNRVAVALIAKDLDIICKGTLMWWGRSAEEPEPLHETLEHLCFNLLYAYSSDKYQETDYPRFLLTELPAFTGAIQIRGVPLHGKPPA